jgi:hypothetical protein
MLCDIDEPARHITLTCDIERKGTIRMSIEEHVKEDRFTSKNKEHPCSISNSCFDYTPSGKILANILSTYILERRGTTRNDAERRGTTQGPFTTEYPPGTMRNDARSVHYGVPPWNDAERRKVRSVRERRQ